VVGDRLAGRDDHLHQEASAIRCRKDLLDEQTVHAVVGIAICEREVQGSLHLPAELSYLTLCLPVRRPGTGIAFVQSFCEVRIDELRFFTTTFELFQDKATLLR